MIFFAQLQDFLSLLLAHQDLAKTWHRADINEVRELIGVQIEAARELAHEQHLTVRPRVLDITESLQEQLLDATSREAMERGVFDLWLDQTIHKTQVAMSEFRLATREAS